MHLVWMRALSVLVHVPASHCMYLCAGVGVCGCVCVSACVLEPVLCLFVVSEVWCDRPGLSSTCHSGSTVTESDTVCKMVWHAQISADVWWQDWGTLHTCMRVFMCVPADTPTPFLCLTLLCVLRCPSRFHLNVCFSFWLLCYSSYLCCTVCHNMQYSLGPG